MHWMCVDSGTFGCLSVCIFATSVVKFARMKPDLGQLSLSLKVAYQTCTQSYVLSVERHGYCNFTNFQCVKLSVASERRAFVFV